MEGPLLKYGSTSPTKEDAVFSKTFEGETRGGPPAGRARRALWAPPAARRGHGGSAHCRRGGGAGGRGARSRSQAGFGMCQKNEKSVVKFLVKPSTSSMGGDPILRPDPWLPPGPGLTCSPMSLWGSRINDQDARIYLMPTESKER